MKYFICSRDLYCISSFISQTGCTQKGIQAIFSYFFGLIYFNYFNYVFVNFQAFSIFQDVPTTLHKVNDENQPPAESRPAQKTFWPPPPPVPTGSAASRLNFVIHQDDEPLAASSPAAENRVSKYGAIGCERSANSSANSSGAELDPYSLYSKSSASEFRRNNDSISSTTTNEDDCCDEEELLEEEYVMPSTASEAAGMDTSLVRREAEIKSVILEVEEYAQDILLGMIEREVRTTFKIHLKNRKYVNSQPRLAFWCTRVSFIMFVRGEADIK
jgi:hypothetical protein